MPLKLTVGFSDNPRIQPLKDGSVRPQNVTLEVIIAPPSDLFYRNLKYNEFDVSEMSMSTLLMARDRRKGAEWDWLALPVFPSKAFAWLDLYVNAKSGIKHPRDLKGKRIGMGDYTVTAALWMREQLRELYGIQPKDNIWYNGRLLELSVGTMLGLDKYKPAGTELHWLTEDQTLDDMLDEGELDAAYGLSEPDAQLKGGALSINRRGSTATSGNPHIRKLFKDQGRGVMLEYYRKMGFLPRNHFVVVKGRLVRENPWLPLELFKAFEQAKRVTYERARKALSGYLLFEGGQEFQEQAALYGEDPYPYGIRAQRAMLEVLFKASLEQGLIKKPTRIEDVFCPSTLDT